MQISTTYSRVTEVQATPGVSNRNMLHLAFLGRKGETVEMSFEMDADLARRLAEAINSVNADPKVETFPSEAA